MRFSLRTNNDLPIGELVELAQTGEAAGFDQLWVSNDLFLRSAPALIGHLAARTERIDLGIGIMNPYSVHPAEIAMTAATLQEISGGRFRLGLGAGAAEFLDWIGIQRTEPLRRTREAIVAIRSLLDGGRPTDDPEAGVGWADQAHLRFTAPHAPIYLGAMSPRMLALTGTHADGALPLLFPPEHYPEAARRITEAAIAAGRDPAEIDIAACIWCSIDDDPLAARRALARKLAYFGPSFPPFLLERAGLASSAFDAIEREVRGGDIEAAADLVTDDLLALGIAGNPQDVLERCRWLADQGARHLSFGPPLGPSTIAAVEALGREVLPQLRDRSG